MARCGRQVCSRIPQMWFCLDDTPNEDLSEIPGEFTHEGGYRELIGSIAVGSSQATRSRSP